MEAQALVVEEWVETRGGLVRDVAVAHLSEGTR